MNGLEWTFDTVASAYERLRPGYVSGVYERIFSYAPIDASSRVVEVGIGGGQATLPVLQSGCTLTAVEYGAQFSGLCRKKFREYPKFSVITGRFEETAFERDAFDLVFSASAFHWVPEKTGYEKVYEMLKSGGAFARFANHPHPDRGNPALREEIDRLYERYYYKFHSRKEKTAAEEYGEEQAAQRAGIAAKYGFEEIQWELFQRTRTFSAREYTLLLGTYSDHIVLEENLRNEFFAAIEDAINRHGGSIAVYDTIDLQLARKP